MSENRAGFKELGNKVKLVVYSEGGQRDTFYNFGREQHLPEAKIVGKMIQRILVEKKQGNFKTALFYNVASNKEVMRINN